MTYEEIQTKIEELKLKFEPCYKLTAEDMDDIMDILELLKDNNSVYSVDEKIIGYDDINSKLIYRKCITFEGTGDELYTITHNLDIDEYFKIDYKFKRLTNGTPDQTLQDINTLYNFLVNEDPLNSGYTNFATFPNYITFGKLNVAIDDVVGHIILEYTKN